jgi:predicted TIM-barrel fold metal-dependent hydrolase
MIVDMHVHLYNEGWVPSSWMLAIGRILSANMGKDTGEFPDPQEVMTTYADQLRDPTGDELIADMDEAGVDVSVIFPLDYALGADEPPCGTQDCIPIAEQNRIFGEIAKKNGKRLIYFASVDPRRKGAIKILERGVSELDARGLKLHPTTGFYPDDPVCYPFYEKALELNIPVLFHTGTQPAPLKPQYARPVLVDTVAAEFPDLKIIMAHVGHCWWEEALALATVKPNLYVEFSGWQPTFTVYPGKFYAMLREALDMIGPWRVMYGTDNPYLKLLLS